MKIPNATEAYKALSQKDVWIVRYFIATALLIFLCWQASIWTKACTVDLECLRPNVKDIFEMLKSGIFWVFVVIILGKGIVPLINKVAETRFGIAGVAPVSQAVTNEKTVTTKEVNTVTPAAAVTPTAGA